MLGLLNDHPGVGPLFLYLNQVGHVDAWVRGGRVPINPASRYVDEERHGVMTPDELLQRSTTGLDDAQAHMVASLFEIEDSKNCRIIECDIANSYGRTIINFATINTRREDSLILCVSKTLSRRAAARFGGKAAVVQLLDPQRLMDEISEQLGVEGVLGEVEYTIGINRGDYLKSFEDGWQSEVRMSWPIRDGKERWVTLSPGQARPIDLARSPKILGSMPLHNGLKRIPLTVRFGRGPWMVFLD